MEWLLMLTFVFSGQVVTKTEKVYPTLEACLKAGTETIAPIRKKGIGVGFSCSYAE